MKKILLTRGKFTIIDDENFEFLNQYKWYCDAYGYAVRDVGGRKNKKHIHMHRIINNTPENFFTDHINRNTFDNRKSNLRTVTGSQNGINRGLNKNNTSGFRGVVWRKDIEKWQASLKLNYKTIYLGCYKTIKEAVDNRKKAEKEYFKIEELL